MVYVGMDVHRKRTQVAILERDGSVVSNRRLGNFDGSLQETLHRLDPGTPVVMEAAYGWGWLADLAQELHLELHLAHPRNCKAIAAARLKNDKVDAATLAHLLRTDLLPEAWIPPQEIRDLRRLVRHRVALVRAQSAAKNRIHAVMADEGVSYEEGDLFTDAGRAWVTSLQLAVTSFKVVSDCLGLIDHLQKPITALDGYIRRRAKNDRRVAALKALPGIGDFVATALIAEIGDISRFPDARRLCSWAGLTPSVRASDNKVRHGHISKQGSVWVRWVLVQAAHKAKTRAPFAADYARIAKRRGKNVATVAIARKLLTRCFYILRDQSRSEGSATR
jgi:transposase